jgi:polysaccharide deacetylase 2 family uncharacterized protein YibQ
MRRFIRIFKRIPFLAILIAAILIAMVVIISERQEPVVHRTIEPDGGRTRPLEDKFRPELLPPARPQTETKRESRKIAVIIDDIGYDLRLAEALAKIDVPVACAVLPNTAHAAAAARLLHRAGKEILLHLPMEPRSYPADNPGSGALFVNMDDAEIRRQIEADLAAVPHVSGVNNHMGSLFMEDEVRLSFVMNEIARRGLFFVDSRTTPDSKGKEAAARTGIRFAERTLFIDHIPGYATTLSTLTHLPRQMREREQPLLMIGHPHPETVRAIKEAEPIWQAAGVRVIPVSAYLKWTDEKRKADIVVKKAVTHKNSEGGNH